MYNSIKPIEKFSRQYFINSLIPPKLWDKFKKVIKKMASYDFKLYFTGVCGAELLLQVNGEDIEVYTYILQIHVF